MLFWFGLRQHIRRYFHQFRYPRAVFPTVFLDQQKRFGARVRRSFFHRTHERTTRVRRLHEELIVTDQRDDLFIAIERVLAEHFSVTNNPGIGHLVPQEVRGGLAGRHVRGRVYRTGLPHHP